MLGKVCLASIAWRWPLCAKMIVMAQRVKPVEGTISPKYQITIPATVREAMGLQPGDKIEFALEQNNVLELRVKRPNPSDLIVAILAQYDISPLQTETQNDAVKALRANRWDDAL